MLTQWARTAFLSGLDGVTGGTLTVACAGRTYRYGEPGELDATHSRRPRSAQPRPRSAS